MPEKPVGATAFPEKPLLVGADVVMRGPLPLASLVVPVSEVPPPVATVPTGHATLPLADPDDGANDC